MFRYNKTIIKTNVFYKIIIFLIRPARSETFFEMSKNQWLCIPGINRNESQMMIERINIYSRDEWMNEYICIYFRDEWWMYIYSRDECDVLENDICRTELAIAKSHPMIGHQMGLPECTELPPIGSRKHINQ